MTISISPTQEESREVMTSNSEKSKIAVWLVEDHTGFRNTFSYLVDHAQGMECTQVFGSCEHALEFADSSDNVPDIIVLDINLPGIDGIEGISRFKSIFPDKPIVMLTIKDDAALIYQALRAGASGYLLKSSPVDQMLEALRETDRGGTIMPAPVAEKVLAFFRPKDASEEYGLSNRELEVLEHMASGQSYQQIADSLFLSIHTVNTHLRHIYAKLHVRSGVEAVVKAVREGLV